MMVSHRTRVALRRAWKHASLVTPLVGALLPACASPHDPAVLDRLDCNTCHPDLYDSTPIHAERGYSRECYACHGTLEWTRVDASHDRFPIGRGSHRGYDCSECHLSRERPSEITCIDCHEHREGRVRPFHLGNSEFQYTPSSCFSCHRGE